MQPSSQILLSIANFFCQGTTSVENVLLPRISACRQPVHRGSFSFESRSCSHLLDPLMTDPQAANNYAADRLRPRYTRTCSIRHTTTQKANFSLTSDAHLRRPSKPNARNKYRIHSQFPIPFHVAKKLRRDESTRSLTLRWKNTTEYTDIEVI
jgi:hypothetical protein